MRPSRGQRTPRRAHKRLVMRAVLEHRAIVSLAASAVAGAAGLHGYPFPSDHPVLALIRLERPLVFAGFTYSYAVLWFTSTFFIASIGLSSIYIFGARGDQDVRRQPLPPYPAPEDREDLFVVLGEQHRPTTPGPSPAPQ